MNMTEDVLNEFMCQNENMNLWNNKMRQEYILIPTPFNCWFGFVNEFGFVVCGLCKSGFEMLMGRCVSTCPVGFTMISNEEVSPFPTCIKCLEGCTSCTSNLQCTSCDVGAGFVQTTNNNFTFCQKVNCLNQTDTYWNGSLCTPCASNCAMCNG